MPQAEQHFSLAAARPALERALRQAGYDLLPDDAEPNLLQSRRDAGMTTSVVIDAGGRLRFTRTRQVAPVEARIHRTPSGRVWRATQEVAETLTVSYQLTPADAAGFAALLAELHQLA